ncbi:Putative RNA polymerase II subunit B1 CTD phosphatase RPAP2 homolog [Striga hermonthica]|uniref:RNA polymerase II subunit B1 CTD phosphatase RPAP2 homolog n=1 Tax=Striga hermonthica TaxID=68872 RepID=A0A9N7NYV9_STRHE|nr:Putative RNA polymerase II subunit B1 CTD phosphatase RPAP2 homolog [Striga hermonthica]
MDYLETMKHEVQTVKDAVLKLQFSLLEGIKHESQLMTSGALLSQSDYQDVVTERSIAGMCGHPLCTNPLPTERPWKGRYRVSLKEHKVYDLQETYMYCSTGCLINSRTFAASLKEERPSDLKPAKLSGILNLFYGPSLGPDDAVASGGGDMGLSGLRIEEKMDTTAGEVSVEEWIGPSNAIDGYVPRREKNMEAGRSNNDRGSGKKEHIGLSYEDMDFTSVIITQDEYSVSKIVPPVKDKDKKGKARSNEVNRLGNLTQKPNAPSVSTQEMRSKNLNKSEDMSTSDGKVGLLEDKIAGPSQNVAKKGGKELQLGSEKSKDVTTMDYKVCVNEGPSQNNSQKDGKESQMGKDLTAGVLKSSLKTSDSNRTNRSVTWADEKTNADVRNLCEVKGLKDEEVGQESYRFVSAEACAMALSQAAEAVASGECEASDAASEAGVIILPSPHGEGEVKSEENGDVVDTEPLQLKWPPKPGFSEADLLDSEDSWYDSPPEGFNLSLSPFSTMFMALFAWMSSSSLAYIYGKDESFHEDYLSINGREYPRKVVMLDGRSSEIKITLAGCLSRALPGLVAELRLPIPISTLEQGMGHLLDTMSFMDPLPAFRMKQWQVIVLLFLDALSVARIPALTQHMVGRRILLPKVLEGAQISMDEFEIMKDVMIPLGRVPQFSTQSGG